MVLSDFTSKKFRFWSFIAMFLLVFVHGYNLNISYLRPWTTPNEPLNFTTFFEYFLANGIFRFRIPMLFIISGYLFALHDQKPYKERVNKRLKTLLVPYLIWSGVALILTYLLESIPFGSKVVADAGIVQIDNTRMVMHQYHWYEIAGRWIFKPIPYQLWFIRVLLVYNIAYPLILWCLKSPRSRGIFFSIAFLMWLGSVNLFFVEGEGLLFFSLGIWIQKSGFSIEMPNRWLKPSVWGTIFVSVAIFKTWLAFKGEAILGNALYPVLTILYKTVVLSGLISCWFGLDRFVRWLYAKDWFRWLSAFAFMIYALHVPIVDYLTHPAMDLFRNLPESRLWAFFLLPVFVIFLAVTTGALIRKISPRIYGILTGGRGL
jgi:fucose 4-O-acetylase-like acetyltransferase